MQRTVTTTVDVADDAAYIDLLQDYNNDPRVVRWVATGMNANMMQQMRKNGHAVRWLTPAARGGKSVKKWLRYGK